MLNKREREIQERAEKATPGYWTWRHFPGRGEWAHHGPDLVADTGDVEDNTVDVAVAFGYDRSGLEIEDADAEFIAHARTDIPYLLETIRKLRNQPQHDKALVEFANAYIAVATGRGEDFVLWDVKAYDAEEECESALLIASYRRVADAMRELGIVEPPQLAAYR